LHARNRWRLVLVIRGMVLRSSAACERVPRYGPCRRSPGRGSAVGRGSTAQRTFPSLTARRILAAGETFGDRAAIDFDQQGPKRKRNQQHSGKKRLNVEPKTESA
jgi:hypothetical protein